MSAEQIQWHTAQLLHPRLVQAVREHSRPLTAWFGLGAAVGSLAMAAAVLVLVGTAASHLLLPRDSRLRPLLVRLQARWGVSAGL